METLQHLWLNYRIEIHSNGLYFLINYTPIHKRILHTEQFESLADIPIGLESFKKIVDF